MCNAPHNECSKSGCGRIEALITPLKLCSKAKSRNRPCSKPEKLVVDKTERQLCIKCSGRKELHPLEKDRVIASSSKGPGDASDGRAGRAAPSDSAERFEGSDQSMTKNVGSSIKLTSVGGDTGMSLNSQKNTALGTSESNISSSVPPKGKQPLVANAVSKAPDDKEQEVPEGYVTRYKHFACRPVKPLAPEPSEWEEWRNKDPATEQDHPDSRDARYTKSLKTHGDRAWPLPYESYPQYVERQVLKLNRPHEGFKKFHTEYMAWMTGDEQFHSASTLFLEHMRKRQWLIISAIWGRPPCRDGKCNACGNCRGYGVETMVDGHSGPVSSWFRQQVPGATR